MLHFLSGTNRAAQRLIRLALKHEDAAVAEDLAEDLAYLKEVVRVYQDRWHQCSTQWVRYWAALTARVKQLASEGPRS